MRAAKTSQGWVSHFSRFLENAVTSQHEFRHGVCTSLKVTGHKVILECFLFQQSEITVKKSPAVWSNVGRSHLDSVHCLAAAVKSEIGRSA